MDQREYIINVFERRFDPIPSEDEIQMVKEYLDTVGDEYIASLYRSFKIIDGEETFPR